MRTFGTLLLDPAGSWHIHAEPHVVLRLKRVFARLKGAARNVSLKHSQEVARDLAWFLDRYPLEMSASDRAYLEGEAKAHRRKSERFTRVLSGQASARAFDLALPPRDYQRVAADLALEQGGLLIADQVGVGKTVQAICIFTDPRTRPALVVTLTHLPKQWEREIARFAPRLRTHILKGTTPYKLPPQVDVLITNYHKLAGWAAELAGKIRCVVFDEVQELRHQGTNRYQAAQAIAAEAHFRLGLSATPIHNLGSEFFSVLEAVRPGAVGTRAEFLQEWCTAADMRGNAAIADPSAFGAYLREQAIMIRRTREDVGRELPPLTIVPHTVESDDAFDAVDGVSELATYILSRSGAAFDQMKARGELDWKLRQATGIAKAKYVAGFVRMLVESGERVLLYGWHHAVYDIWVDKLHDLGVAKFTGEETPREKERARAEFESGEAKVLIMSLRAGAGLDGLQHACSTVVFGELDWSPAVHEQATGRVFRDGQPSPVIAYYLVSDEGSDPVIQSTLGLKRAQLEGVRSRDAEREIAASVKVDGVLELAREVLRRQGTLSRTEAAE